MGRQDWRGKDPLRVFSQALQVFLCTSVSLLFHPCVAMSPILFDTSFVMALMLPSSIILLYVAVSSFSGSLTSLLCVLVKSSFVAAFRRATQINYS